LKFGGERRRGLDAKGGVSPFLVLHQPALSLTHERDFQSRKRLNQWRPAIGGRDYGISDRQSDNFADGTLLRHVSGIHQGQDGPFAFEDRLISLACVPGAMDADFTSQSPSAWLLQSVPWTQARHRISAITASADVSVHLAIPRYTPCLLVERWTWRAGVPVTYVCQTFRGDCFDLVATFTPEGR
jgi:GntR family histidine utilization transcriptional repressor